MDKAVFALTRAIIGNKRARSFFVFYTAALVSISLGVSRVPWGKGYVDCCIGREADSC